MSENIQEIISVPSVADGNPSTAMALAALLRRAGGDPTEVDLSFVSRPIDIFHRRISRDPEAALRYTENSEERRLAPLAHMASLAYFAEFATRLAVDDDHSRHLPSRWTAVQEHPVIGASPEKLDRLGITAVRIAVPDVFPKESAKFAVSKIPGARFSVWNTAARDELAAEGLAVDLHSPYILDGLRPDDPEFYRQGMNVIVKSSGSGMPREWSDELRATLAQLHDVTWGFHTPQGRTSHNFEVMKAVPKRNRIQNFYNDLGGNTQVLFCYPTELTGVVSAMRERGINVWMITFPPRGAHERRNLRYAIDNNLVLGEFSPRDYNHPPTYADLEAITMTQLPGIIKNLPEAKWSEGLIGTESIWADAA